MSMKKWGVGFLLATSLWAVQPAVYAYAADANPEVLVRNTAQEVLTILKQEKDLKNNSRKVANLIESKILPHFNFNRMTQLAMGKNWKKASPEQQNVLVSEFKTLLVKTYSNSLANYRNQTIDVKPVRPDNNANEVVVKVAVSQPNGKPIAIDYSMERANNSWKVYDVVIEGMSLVTNYRSTFAQKVREGGIDGLIQALKDKNSQS